MRLFPLVARLVEECCQSCFFFSCWWCWGRRGLSWIQRISYDFRSSRGSDPLRLTSSPSSFLSNRTVICPVPIAPPPRPNPPIPRLFINSARELCSTRRSTRSSRPPTVAEVPAMYLAAVPPFFSLGLGAIRRMMTEVERGIWWWSSTRTE